MFTVVFLSYTNSRDSFIEAHRIGCGTQLERKFRPTKTILNERASACWGASDCREQSPVNWEGAQLPGFVFYRSEAPQLFSSGGTFRLSWVPQPIWSASINESREFVYDMRSNLSNKQHFYSKQNVQQNLRNKNVAFQCKSNSLQEIFVIWSFDPLPDINILDLHSLFTRPPPQDYITKRKTHKNLKIQMR